MQLQNLPSEDLQFYPTSESAKSLMFSKICKKKSFRKILDPTAGKGDLLHGYKEGKGRYSGCELFAIEKDPNLRKILIHDEVKIVDTDFLTYSGIDTYDLILMNPPFKNGDEFLLHALNFVIDGQIICLLNAETIKNPYSNRRKELVQKLNSLNAEIEFHKDLFKDAERKTDVEVALISIIINNDCEKIFKPESFEQEQEIDIDINNTEIKKHKIIDINTLIEDYEEEKARGVKVIYNFFKDTYGLKDYFQLLIRGIKYQGNESFDYTGFKKAITKFSNTLKYEYWNKLITLPMFEEKLTTNAKIEFFKLLDVYENMEFNYNNIHILYDNILSSTLNLIEESILTFFDDVTGGYNYYPETKKNVYLYNGWKTNNGYKINKRFILPISIRDNICYPTSSEEKFRDIEKIFIYFNNGRKPEKPLAEAFKEFKKNKSRDSNQFENELIHCRYYQKGTCHFTIKDENLLRRLNIYVGKRRQWLPPDYAYKSYNDCTEEEQLLINNFEGEKNYHTEEEQLLQIEVL